MNEQDLDRIIDTATADIIEREPSRTLRHAVMARVRESKPSASRRFVWASGAAMAILCAAAIAIVLLNRTAPTPAGDGNVRLKPDVATRSVELKPDPDADGGVRLQPDVERASRRSVAAAVVRRVPSVTFPPNDLLTSIEPITAEPLHLPSIELPPLEQQAASVEELQIEQLTIEPLTASND